MGGGAQDLPRVGYVLAFCSILIFLCSYVLMFLCVCMYVCGTYGYMC